MRSKPALVLASVAAIALGACTTSTAAPSVPAASPIAVATLTATAVPQSSANPAASPSAEPSASSGGGVEPKPTPGSIDPCTLLKVEEASRIIGKTLSDGVSTTLDPDRVCTFKNGKSEVKVFLAPPAPDVKVATAYWDARRSTVPEGVSVKDLPDFDRSAYAFGSAGGQSLSGLFVIDGTKVFEVYCEFPACSQKASLGAAQLIDGRLH